jgi:flagellar FliL protein
MRNKNKKSAGGSSSRSLLVIFMLILTLGACAAAGYLFLEVNKLKNSGVQEAFAAETVVLNKDPLYVPLNTFTVSLKPTNNESDRVLFIGLSLNLADQKSQQTLEKHLPEYRSRIFLLLSGLTYEDLVSNEGKSQLITRISQEISKPLAMNQSVKVSDVLFNEFILR